MLWKNLIHNGPYFPKPYIKHNIPVIINNKEIILDSLAEEYATLYSKYLNSDYIQNPRFNKNFMIDFVKVLPNHLKKTKIDDIDFSKIKKYIENQQEKKRNLTKEQKEKIKKINYDLEEPFMFCFIDGQQQKVGNYKIEPPGIFLGRGNHPKIGRIKPRIYPKDVTINISKDAPIPKPNIEFNYPKENIIHDKNVIWLASWKDPITNKNKYIFTSMESVFKSESDKKKFDLARKLKKRIKNIRLTYESDLTNNNIKNKQLATALYFIDNLAIRVGNKKNTKEAADTVGATNLRVEHITLTDPNIIKLDFLGKDSIRYCKKTSVNTIVYSNLVEFIRGKNPKDQLFDKINSSDLNNYLSSFMKGLTAKVWRTYNASSLFQKELDKITKNRIEKVSEGDRLNYLVSLFNSANSEVAALCNHQKNVSSNLEANIEKLKDKIKKYRKKINKTNKKEKKENYQSKIKLIKQKIENKSKMKNISLGTSKTNYIDPRIIFAFFNKFDINDNNRFKLLPEKLIERFKWASDVKESFRF